MVKSYLNYELKDTFGVVAAPTGELLLDISSGGKLAYSASLENVTIWNVKQGMLVDVLKGEQFQVTAMELSPNGQYLAVGYADG
jgi:U3 small nucleolar RNA-associated protein 12